MPLRKNRGTKQATIISVEFRIGILTSFDASKTTSNIGCCSPSGFILLRRKCLNTFSTSIMASSTNEPMAIAIPPKLIVLMVNPINLSVRMDTNSDNGIAINEMNVVRAFIKNKKSTITTKTEPS